MRLSQWCFTIAVAVVGALSSRAVPPAPSPPWLRQHGGVNHGLRSSVTIVGNRMGREAVTTVAQLQRVLDSNPNTVFFVSESSYTIDKTDPQPIRLHSNRSLVMDAATTIVCDGVVMPPTDPTPPQNVSGYGGVVVLSGSNIALSGGRIEQAALDLVCKYGPDRDTGGSCNFGVDVFNAADAKVTGVTINGSFSDAIRVFAGQGIARGKPVADTFGKAALGALARRPVVLAHNTLINPYNHGNCSTCTVQPRAIWLIVSAGVIVSSNTVTGPWLYGIDMDSEASFCTITNNTVTDSLYASIFVEMQCTGNMITANTVRQSGANPHQTCAGIHVDSYLNSVVANDFGGNGMCVSGLAQGQVYPPALANRFVDNIAPVLDLGSSGRAGCANFASENKAANGSYTMVEDFFTVVNRAHQIPFDRSVCIDPDSADNDAENWATVSDVATTATTGNDSEKEPPA
jgi:parallel beta-helix repeat protein